MILCPEEIIYFLNENISNFYLLECQPLFLSGFPSVCLGLHLWRMEVPRLGVELELQLLACVTATITLDLSHVCDLHRSSWQCWILNPLSKALGRTHILVDTRKVR